MSKFYIVNCADRPCERLIAEMRDDGLLYYVNPEMLPHWQDMGMVAGWASSLDDFGLDIRIENGKLFGSVVRPSVALYTDGKIRPWQGSSRFSFNYEK